MTWLLSMKEKAFLLVVISILIVIMHYKLLQIRITLQLLMKVALPLHKKFPQPCLLVYWDTPTIARTTPSKQLAKPSMNVSNLLLPRPAVGLLVKAELRMTANKGIGVFAKEFIPANTRIDNTNVTYYNEQEAIAYLDSLPSDEHRKYWLEHGYGKYGMIAATDGDDEMVNHSSNPNIAEGDDGHDYSIRDIYEEEEITEDYTDFEDEVPFYTELCKKYGVPTSVEGFVDD